MAMYHVLHFSFPMLSHESLPHTESNAALVQSLVGRYRHADLVPHPEKEKPSLRTIDGYLPDQLVEALRVELLSDGADASFTSLPLLKFLIQILLQINNIQSVIIPRHIRGIQKRGRYWLGVSEIGSEMEGKNMDLWIHTALTE